MLSRSTMQFWQKQLITLDSGGCREAMLPYKPCYYGFKKNIFDQVKVQEQTRLLQQEQQELNVHQTHNSAFQQPRKLTTTPSPKIGSVSTRPCYMGHFKLSDTSSKGVAPKRTPSRMRSYSSNSQLLRMSTTQGYIPTSCSTNRVAIKQFLWGNSVPPLLLLR